MTMTRLFVILAGLMARAGAAQETPLFITPTQQGVALRWLWGDGPRPAGYFVERRASSDAPWTRLTPRPITRVRDRSAARAVLADAFDRYSGLLFPESPAGERSDPEAMRGMLLLSADLEPRVAHVLGLRYDDATASAGSAYEYRLIELGSGGERVAATGGAVIAGGYRAPPGPARVTVVPGARGAALRWAPQERFSGYHVYRSPRRDAAGARRLNDAPVIIFMRGDGASGESSAIFFTDTAPARDSAFYQVRGIDMFGRPSDASPVVAYVHRVPVELAAPVLPRATVAGDTVIVSWQPPADGRAARYQLWRADSATGRFVRVGGVVRAPGVEQRDSRRPVRSVSWYRVTALDDQGRESEPSAVALAEIPDRVAPPAPDSLSGAPASGRITLRWRQVAAVDLRGYRVYRASGDSGAFVLLQAAPRLAAAYTDTIRARADHVFRYRVTAVDSSFNESAPSQVVAVRPPDTTPPSAPQISGVRRLEGALVVAWLGNPEPDVVSYRVRYRARGEASWRDRPARPATSTADTITALTPGVRYEVTVIAVDDAHHPSPPAASATAAPARPREPSRPASRGRRGTSPQAGGQ